MELQYMITVAILLIILVASFIPIVLLPAEYHAVIEITLFFPRFLLTVCLVFFFLMSTIFNKKERNGLSSARRTLQLIRDQDILPSLKDHRRLDSIKTSYSTSWLRQRREADESTFLLAWSVNCFKCLSIYLLKSPPRENERNYFVWSLLTYKLANI